MRKIINGNTIYVSRFVLYYLLILNKSYVCYVRRVVGFVFKNDDDRTTRSSHSESVAFRKCNQNQVNAFLFLSSTIYSTRTCGFYCRSVTNSSRIRARDDNTSFNSSRPPNCSCSKHWPHSTESSGRTFLIKFISFFQVFISTGNNLQVLCYFYCILRVGILKYRNNQLIFV